MTSMDDRCENCGHIADCCGNCACKDRDWVRAKSRALCVCGHARFDHIYEVGPCRPGHICPSRCEEFSPADEQTSAVDTKRLEQGVRALSNKLGDMLNWGELRPLDVFYYLDNLLKEAIK